MTHWQLCDNMIRRIEEARFGSTEERQSCHRGSADRSSAVCKQAFSQLCAVLPLCTVTCADRRKNEELSEAEEEEELERRQAAVEIVGEMQLTAEQLKVVC